MLFDPQTGQYYDPATHELTARGPVARDFLEARWWDRAINPMTYGFNTGDEASATFGTNITPQSINAAPAGKSYADLLNDVMTYREGDIDAIGELLMLNRAGYMQTLPGYDPEHWESIRPELERIIEENRKASNVQGLTNVLSVVGAPLVGMLLPQTLW
jgi:hypothetical protein